MPQIQISQVQGTGLPLIFLSVHYMYSLDYLGLSDLGRRQISKCYFPIDCL